MRNALHSTLGTGVYDLGEAAYLLGISERTLIRWSRPSGGNRKPALVAPSHGWAFSFHDLLSLAVVAVFRQREITPDGIRNTVSYLQEEFGTERPLAHEGVVNALQTVGRSVLLSPGIDVTKGGQLALVETVRQYLRPVSYGSDQLAELWNPAKHILLDPSIQAGRPCISHTRVTTDVVASRLEQGESPRLISRDLQISVGQVAAAARFEARLQSGEGLALVA